MMLKIILKLKCRIYKRDSKETKNITLQDNNICKDIILPYINL